MIERFVELMSSRVLNPSMSGALLSFLFEWVTLPGSTTLARRQRIFVPVGEVTRIEERSQKLVPTLVLGAHHRTLPFDGFAL